MSKKDKLKNIKPRNVLVGDPDELVDLKLSEWSEESFKQMHAEGEDIIDYEFPNEFDEEEWVWEDDLEN